MKYEISQTLNYHNDRVFKIIELKNKNLVSCSYDSSILFYIKDNNEYKKDYQIQANGPCLSIIQTKDNEICYSEHNNNKISFYDLLERKIKTSISNISNFINLIMIKKYLLLIPGYNELSIINIEQYELIRKIDVQDSGLIYGVCMLNQNMILTGDATKTIRQWKIDGDNLILISKKENAHDEGINTLLNIGNGLIASGSDDHSIKIW